MVLLLGGTGYVGEAFALELARRQIDHRVLSRSSEDYTRFDVLRSILKRERPVFLINAAGYTGKPNVDACESDKAGTLQGNALFPAMVAMACATEGVAWGHVSSGCIFSGAKVRRNGVWEVHRDLNTPELRSLFDRDPALFAGFTEKDEPNFSFRRPPCSFYSGSKALGEESIVGTGSSYIWRLRIPFDGNDGPRNYLSKLQRYTKAYDNINAISHREDFARACLDLWVARAPFGIYNVVNPGAVSTRQVIERMKRALGLQREFEYWADDREFYDKAARAPRSNCILDASKLLAAGVAMRPVEAALDSALANWVPEARSS